MDGLHRQCGMQVWDGEEAAPPRGGVVEMHGSLCHAVCRECGAVRSVSSDTS